MRNDEMETLIELAALDLTRRPGDRFTASQLFNKAEEYVSGPMNKRHFTRVLKKTRTLSRQVMYCLS